MDELDHFSKQNGFTRLTQISHGYTSPTLLSMLTGMNPTSLMPAGYGYNGYLNHENFCSFRNTYSDHMISVLRDKGYTFHNNNRIGFCCRDLLAVGCHGLEMPEGINALKFGDYYVDNLPRFQQFDHVKLTESNPESNDSFSGFGDSKLCKEWYDNEARTIKNIQSSNDNIFYLHQTHHWGATEEVGWTRPTVSKEHAINHTIDWLSNWDLDEPDSLFWIFADHGLPNEENNLVYPNSYLSWALIKDNTTSKITPGRKVIHPTDFYPTIMKKIGATYSSNISGMCISLPLEKDRVYVSEDARLKYNPLYTTNYSLVTCESFDDHGEVNRMLQTTMFIPEQQVSMVDYHFEPRHLRNNKDMAGKKFHHVTDVSLDRLYIDSYDRLRKVFL